MPRLTPIRTDMERALLDAARRYVRAASGAERETAYHDLQRLVEQAEAEDRDDDRTTH